MRSDAEIVEAVLTGDRAAFALLVRRYGRAVRAAALSVLGDHHAAEDIEQETFMTAYRTLATLRSGSRFGPWLVMVTRRLSLAALRRRQRRKAASLEDVPEPPTPATDGRLSEPLRRLLAVVMRLPKHERQAVMLRYFGGHGVREVAAITSRPVGTVTKQLHRARQRLRGWLEETDDERGTRYDTGAAARRAGQRP